MHTYLRPYFPSHGGVCTLIYAYIFLIKDIYLPNHRGVCTLIYADTSLIMGAYAHLFTPILP
jgi:hypothetical protein